LQQLIYSNPLRLDLLREYYKMLEKYTSLAQWSLR
jgi:hypothetical protein